MEPFSRLAVAPASVVTLGSCDSGDTLGWTREDALIRTEANRNRLAELHQLLWAENTRSVLIVLQGMDTSGKDGVIRSVMTGLNPQGCTVTSFKKPVGEEADHMYLWRIARALPARGDIGLFNRSHYEDVLIVRVHELVPKRVWKDRYDQINDFERLIADNDTTILKFFLHISKKEQKERLEERLADPAKNWKFSPQDLEERKHWNEYQQAYEDVLSRCSTTHAPWYIVPSDRKWVRNLVVSSVIVEAMEKLDMKWPRPAFDPKSIVVE